MARRDRKHGPVLSDWHLWSSVKKSVRPLRPIAEPAAEPFSPVPAPPSEGATGDPRSIKPRAGIRPSRRAATALAGLPGNPPGLEPRVRRRLVRGQVPIDGTIDLHGMRQAEARTALHRFIMARAARGDRTILVITGKGIGKTPDGTIAQRGVLRSMLPLWLAEPGIAPLIAGFEVSSRPHGGEGAYYVRLRRVAK